MKLSRRALLKAASALSFAGGAFAQVKTDDASRHRDGPEPLPLEICLTLNDEILKPTRTVVLRSSCTYSTDFYLHYLDIVGECLIDIRRFNKEIISGLLPAHGIAVLYRGVRITDLPFEHIRYLKNGDGVTMKACIRAAKDGGNIHDIDSLLEHRLAEMVG